MTQTKEQTALEILATVSGVALDEITPEKDLAADLGIDSPKALRLLVELEDRLEIEISDEDAARMSTVGDVTSYLAALGS
jgi:acyl carrier protein